MSIQSNLVQIKEQIRIAAGRAGRDPAAIKLIAVTKYTGVDRINEAIGAGVTDIAENRVQDGVAKFPLLEKSVTRHLIGTLQTNKVKTALSTFDLIHSVDRLELIEALAKEAAKLERQVKFLLQLNISGESTKHGLHPDDLPGVLAKIRSFNHLIPVGLMTIAPLVDKAEQDQVRPIFRRLKNIFEQSEADNPEWRYLSMGMSQDYQVAVEEGANMLRIGTAIFKNC
jgi:pyridoxal phosphate enzyme (YggS family)